jgi:alpha-1,2-glucosyltransferase
MNVALFPVLFFFSGLYYTDVISTCVVLVAYLNHLVRSSQGTGRHSLFNDAYTVLLGILALLMRQTNVFWIVVYMGGLEGVQAIRDISATFEAPVLDTWVERVKFFAWESSAGSIHDPPLQDAWPEDIVLCVVSITIALIFNIGTVLRRIYPHIVVVCLFAGFVVWNGGVVLGDKTNHVATLHLAQMLYIWPLFSFFSAPLFIPQALRLLESIQMSTTFKSASKSAKPVEKSQTDPPTKVNHFGILLSACVLAGSIVAAALIIRYNTIVHPFTLADNRHYMFYVFRYSIMRGRTIRLLLAPVYVGCAILVWTSLYQLKPHEVSATASSQPNTSSTRVFTSEVIILLVTTTLSLMTAPLVEPRYFILPWIFWRLSVPRRTNNGPKGVDWTLALETGWFLVVNIVLMYIFLARPFVWKIEDGRTLDGGNVQRFMW